MNKIKKLKFGLSVSIGVIILLAVIAVVGSVKAYQSYNAPPKNVMENVNYYEAAQTVEVIQPDESFGSMTSPDISSRYLCINGDCTFYITGDFQDATTTIVSFPNPFKTATTTDADVSLTSIDATGHALTGATSTVDLVRLDIRTAATSTYSVSCGASTGYAAADTVSLLDTATDGSGIATGTPGILENKLTAALGGVLDAGTVEKITLNPKYPWFTCTITTPTAYASNFTGAANTFDGKFSVQVHKTR